MQNFSEADRCTRGLKEGFIGVLSQGMFIWLMRDRKFDDDALLFV